MPVRSRHEIRVKLIEPCCHTDVPTIWNEKKRAIVGERFDDVLSNRVFDDKINMEEDTDEIDHYSHID